MIRIRFGRNYAKSALASWRRAFDKYGDKVSNMSIGPYGISYTIEA